MNNKKTKKLRKAFYKTLKLNEKKLPNKRSLIDGLWVNQEKKAWRKVKKLFKQGNLRIIGS